MRSVNQSRFGGVSSNLWVRAAAGVLALGVLSGGGCNNALEGGVSGGVLGGTAGLIAGSFLGNAGAGAAIGAAAGVVGGAVIGDQNERNSRRHSDW